MKKIIFSIFSLIILFTGNNNELFAASPESPNILLFHADDMNWIDCEPYGNPDVITPNIARLAREGMSFDNMHTSTAMCSPTRQQLYTGIYPVRSGAYPNHSMVYWGVKSMAHYFIDLNYRVALVGKVHHNPFESFPFEFLGGRHHDDGDGIDIHVDRIKPILNQDENPFFVVVSSNQPHTPWNRGNVELYDESKFTIPEYMIDCQHTRTDLKKYYAEITYTDSLLGEAMKYLEEAGKADNTIVIFTSEQGSVFPFAKWTCYDLGLKTAFIVKWPGKVKAGTRNDALTQYIDVVPTLLEAAGKNPESINTGSENTDGDTGFVGLSFLDVMLGKKSDHREYVYGVHTTRGIYNGSICYPIRSVRTKKYKYIVNLSSSSPFHNTASTGNQTIYSEWVKQTSDQPEKHEFVKKYKYRPKEELYDLSLDPFELNNIADKSDLQAIKKELRNELYKWMKLQGDEGIDTEMKAMDRQLRHNEENWKGYEEQSNQRLFRDVK